MEHLGDGHNADSLKRRRVSGKPLCSPRSIRLLADYGRINLRRKNMLPVGELITEKLVPLLVE
jgi:hypothetical protein